MAASDPRNNTSLLQLTLPTESWLGSPINLYQGFWCLDYIFERLIAFQTQFQAHDTDIILASLPKTGTTWLKSLLFTIVNRKNLSHISHHTLRSKNPHELVLHLEFEVYKPSQPADLIEAPAPRLFATHVPYASLPDSIKTSECRIIYITRNPLDTFVSLWHFHLQFEENQGISSNMEMMEEQLSKFCTGTSPFGPYEDHLLGYWKESKKTPLKVLVLEYEALKKEPKTQLKKLAEFVGCPFSNDEEEGNIIDEIINICSLKSLKEMEINKSGKFLPQVGNQALFRKGEIGDWTNYLTPSMAKRFDHIQERLENAGFSFTYYPMNV